MWGNSLSQTQTVLISIAANANPNSAKNTNMDWTLYSNNIVIGYKNQNPVTGLQPIGLVTSDSYGDGKIG